MEHYIETLRQLGKADNAGVASYLLCTRVERNLYGLLNGVFGLQKDASEKGFLLIAGKAGALSRIVRC